MQLSAPFAEKLDAQLARLCNDGLPETGRIAVLVRCAAGSMASVASRLEEQGGTVRHHLRLVGTVAAWLPLSAVEPLARCPDVEMLELEQSFSIA